LLRRLSAYPFFDFVQKRAPINGTHHRGALREGRRWTTAQQRTLRAASKKTRSSEKPRSKGALGDLFLLLRAEIRAELQACIAQAKHTNNKQQQKKLSHSYLRVI